MSEGVIYGGDSYQHRCHEESYEQSQGSWSRLHLDSMQPLANNRNSYFLTIKRIRAIVLSS